MIDELERNFGRMISAHAKESGLFDTARFLPDMKAYRALEAAGKLRVFFWYGGGGEPLGYQVFILAPHPHYAGLLVAHADAVYVRPESRGVGAVRFIERVDDALAGEVDIIARGGKHERLLEWMGYDMKETIRYKKVR